MDDKVTTYLPSPVRVKSNGEFRPVAGYDASNETLHSALTDKITTYDAFGNPRERAISDGIESEVSAFGVEAQFDMGEGWELTNRFRKSDIGGGFISPFTDGFGGGTDTIDNKALSICQGATIDGTAIDCSNITVTAPTGVSGSDFAFTNLTFDTSFDDVGLLVISIKATCLS